jgi:CzcA family heavy metal efflux pump
LSPLEHLRRHQTGVAVIVVSACAFGALALTQLPSALYPEVSFPRVVVAATLPGASAQIMRLSVVRPVEEELAAVIGVRRIRARTIRAASEISVWFDSDADMDRALQLVNAKLAEVRAELPRDTGLVSERITPSSVPILTFAVTGTASPEVLRDAALYTLRPSLAGLPGVGRISVVGGDTREVEVEVNPQRLEQAKLDMTRVATALQEALPLEASGRLDVRYEQNLVVVQGPVTDLAALAQVVVGGTPELPVRLGDIARVIDGHEDRTLLTTANRRAAALVNVGRRPGADAVALAQLARAQVEMLKPSLPPGVDVITTYDQAALIGKAVVNVRDAVFLGGLLTLVVIALFLRSTRGTLAAALSLPATLLMTFGWMRWAGGSLNLMSLGGLAVAIGLVVDDAVVVVEAVHRHLAEGHDAWSASSAALKEIMWPVVNSTITTIVVFAPLSLLGGVTGQFFSALAFTLCAAVLLSLVIALGVTPVVCGRWLKPHAEAPSVLVARYGGLLGRLLRHPGRTVLAGALVLAGFGALAAKVGTGFLPELDEGSFVVDYYTPTATGLVEANRLGAQVEETVAREPEVASTARRLGAELGPPAATEPSRGDITVVLKENHARTTLSVIASARKAVEDAAPGVRVEFVELLQDMLNDLEGTAEPVEVKLLGTDLNALRGFAPKVAQRIKDVDGLVDLYDGVSGCTPEARVEVDPATTGRLGLSAGNVADQVRDSLLGQVVAEVPRFGRIVGVRLRFEDSARFNPDVLDRLRIRPPNSGPVPLAAVAKIETACLPSEILEENLRPMVAVTGRLDEGKDLGTVTSEVEARVKTLTPPPGVEMVIGGQRATQLESFRTLGLVLALALLGVFAVLTFHFRSFVLPLLILGTVPIALAAGVAALRVTGVPLNVSSFMGCILLIGLVVKNGILLLDHAEAEREKGAPALDAALAAARIRVRPILMTTLATLLGLVPLAFGLGTGAELQRPLAIAVIGGLAFSTLAVLLMLPSAYVLARRGRKTLAEMPGLT